MKKIISLLGVSLIILTISFNASKVEASVKEYDTCMESMWYCNAISTAKGDYYNLSFEQEYNTFISCLVEENCYMT